MADLQCYAELIIKKQGLAALRIEAVQTDSLNETLTRTISPTYDLSGYDFFKFWARSSRTGSNFKIEFHDSGGNTISYTPNILQVNSWELKEIDVSDVADVDKNAIDEIKITIIDADVANVIYLDMLRAYDAIDVMAYDSISIAESVSGFDLETEIGPVEESIGISEFDAILLTELNIDVNDSVSIAEAVFLIDIVVELEVNENVSIIEEVVLGVV